MEKVYRNGFEQRPKESESDGFLFQALKSIKIEISSIKKENKSKEITPVIVKQAIDLWLKKNLDWKPKDWTHKIDEHLNALKDEIKEKEERLGSVEGQEKIDLDREISEYHKAFEKLQKSKESVVEKLAEIRDLDSQLSVLSKLEDIESNLRIRWKFDEKALDTWITANLAELMMVASDGVIYSEWRQEILEQKDEIKTYSGETADDLFRAMDSVRVLEKGSEVKVEATDYTLSGEQLAKKFGKWQTFISTRFDDPKLEMPYVMQGGNYGTPLGKNYLVLQSFILVTREDIQKMHSFLNIKERETSKINFQKESGEGTYINPDMIEFHIDSMSKYKKMYLLKKHWLINEFLPRVEKDKYKKKEIQDYIKLIDDAILNIDESVNKIKSNILNKKLTMNQRDKTIEIPAYVIGSKRKILADKSEILKNLKMDDLKNDHDTKECYDLATTPYN